jgi:hypothetical protein
VLNRLGRLLLGVSLGLVAMELLTRAACWIPVVREAVAHRYGPPSSELAWLYRADSVDGAQAFTRYDPELGWTNRPGVYQDVGGTVTVDARGLRVVLGPATPTPNRRIALVGDSFTFGAEAGDGETWADRLAAGLPDDQILNLGVTGYGHDQMVLHHARHAPELRPDVVVLGFNAIDMSRTLLDFFTYAKPIIEAETGDLTPRGLPVPDPDQLTRQLQLRSRLWWFGRMWSWHAYGTSSAFREDGVRRAGALLDAWLADLDAQGIQTVLVYLPMPMEYSDPERSLDELTRTSPERRWMLERCAAGRTCVDTLPAFLDAARAGVDLDAVAHWTAAGNALVAEAVLPALQPTP